MTLLGLVLVWGEVAAIVLMVLMMCLSSKHAERMTMIRCMA